MIQVWDLALRLFHWLLALTVILAIVTGKMGGSYLYWHTDIGIFVLSLLVFRIFWGFLGSKNALFRQFFPSIARLRAFFSSQWLGNGHSPIAGLSTIIMLSLLLAQVVFGLFSINEDMDFTAPLSSLVSSSQSGVISDWHDQLSILIIFMVTAHIIAIIFYLVVKNDNLLLPMITGKKKNVGKKYSKQCINVDRKKLLISLVVPMLVFITLKIVSY